MQDIFITQVLIEKTEHNITPLIPVGLGKFRLKFSGGTYQEKSLLPLDTNQVSVTATGEFVIENPTTLPDLRIEPEP